jgi:hypothetical protein
MGLVIYAAAYYGTRQVLGWTLIFNSAVAFAERVQLGFLALALGGTDLISHFP